MSDTIKVEGKPDDRTPEQAARAAPVSLPAGSYDSEALQRDLDEAAKAKNDGKRDELVAAAVAKHNEIATEAASLDVAPGYKRVDAEVVDLGITESRVVFDAEAAAAAPAPAPSTPAASEASPASKGE